MWKVCEEAGACGDPLLGMGQGERLKMRVEWD